MNKFILIIVVIFFCSCENEKKDFLFFYGNDGEIFEVGINRIIKFNFNDSIKTYFDIENNKKFIDPIFKNEYNYKIDENQLIISDLYNDSKKKYELINLKLDDIKKIQNKYWKSSSDLENEFYSFFDENHFILYDSDKKVLDYGLYNLHKVFDKFYVLTSESSKLFSAPFYIVSNLKENSLSLINVNNNKSILFESYETFIDESFYGKWVLQKFKHQNLYFNYEESDLCPEYLLIDGQVISINQDFITLDNNIAYPYQIGLNSKSLFFDYECFPIKITKKYKDHLILSYYIFDSPISLEYRRQE